MVGVALRRTVQDHRFVRAGFRTDDLVLGNGFSRVALAFGVLSLPWCHPGAVVDRVGLPGHSAAGLRPCRWCCRRPGVRYRLMVGAELLAGFAWLASRR